MISESMMLFRVENLWLRCCLLFVQQIHTLILSQYFTSIEIKTINSINSMGGGVLVMVTGSVKSKEFPGRRKFVQTFFLAPQNKGYYVLNDIFQFLEEEVVLQHQSSMISEGQYDIQLNASSPHREPPGILTPSCWHIFLCC